MGMFLVDEQVGNSARVPPMPKLDQGHRSERGEGPRMQLNGQGPPDVELLSPSRLICVGQCP
eukprot:4391706-Lingulodinium_polyedra.AAC.1